MQLDVSNITMSNVSEILLSGIMQHIYYDFMAKYIKHFVLQEAVAVCFQREYDTFGTEESYFRQQVAQLQHKRLRLTECLKSFGLQAFAPAGGYFITADISTLSESSYQYIHEHTGGVKYIAFRMMKLARQ